MAELDPDILEATAPDYDRYIDEWTMYRDTYDGDPNVIPGYLNKHAREDTSVYDERKKRIFYLNYVAAVVGLWQAYLSKFPPTTELPPDIAEDKDLLAFRQDADLRGRRLEWLLQEADLWACVYGWSGILIDVPHPAAPPLNEAQRVEMGLRPYAVVYTPENIPNWALDERGMLEWIRLREVARDLTGPFDAREEKATLYRTWTRDAWYLDEVHKIDPKGGSQGLSSHETEISPTGDVALPGATRSRPKTKKVVRVAEGAHDLGRVPFVPVYAHRQQGKLIGTSPIRDISKINLRIMNWSSLLDEETYNKCLNILLVPTSNAANPGGDVVIGSRNILEYDTENAPSYLAPPSDPMDQMIRLIEWHRDQIYRLAKMGGVYKMQETGQIGSGIALKQEFLETNQTLRHFADELEQAATGVWDIACRWMKRENGFEGGTINYPEEFGVRDFWEELQALMLVRNEIASETAWHEAQKEFVSIYFPHLAQSKRQEMFDEIEKARKAGATTVNIDPSLDPNAAANRFQGQTRGKLRTMEPPAQE